MLLFTTIIDVTEQLTRERFIDLIVQWNASSKYAENIVPDVKWQGETSIRFGRKDLSIEIADYTEKDILAVRHEKITKDGVVWDTDFIVNFAERKIAIRLDRTYSEDALVMNGKFSTPHFITFLIEKGYLAADQGLPVVREPIYVTDADLARIKHLTGSIEEYQLPVVYVSKTCEDQDPLSVSWLASRLKGAAHVLVERSKGECAACRRALDATEEEFGAVKIYYPAPGVARKRFLFRSATGNMEERLEKVIRHVIQYRNAQRMGLLYTWQGVSGAILSDTLHKQVLKRLEAEDARQNAEEEINQVYEAFDEDIRNLQKKLKELTRANEALQLENSVLRAKLSGNDAAPLIYQGDEEDFYPDEIKDMLLGILTEALNSVDENGRRHDVLEDILENNPYQHLSDEKKQRVKTLFKGYKSLSGTMKQELAALGFEISGDGKHYKLTFHGDSRYMVTIGKTPSDNRSGSNNAAAINKLVF